MPTRRKRNARLQAALLESFSPSSLAQLTQYGLGVSIAEIAGEGGLSEQAFRLIGWTEAQGRTDELIARAIEMNKVFGARLFPDAMQLEFAPTDRLTAR